MAWIYFLVVILFLGLAYLLIGKRVSKIQE